MKNGLTPMGKPGVFPWSRVSGASDGDVRYIYLGEHQPVVWSTGLPMDDGDYEIDIIDTWTMKITPGERIPTPQLHPTRHGSVIRGRKPDAAFGVKLPGRPYPGDSCASEIPSQLNEAKNVVCPDPRCAKGLWLDRRCCMASASTLRMANSSFLSVRRAAESRPCCA